MSNFTYGKNGLPKFIAICGKPLAGKSETQNILKEVFGYESVDDGEPLRKYCIDYLGASKDDVYTQEGKLRETEILGKSYTWRQILGDYGKLLEGYFGEHIMPHMAIEKLKKTGDYFDQFNFSFGSVRKTQGHYFKSIGGVVLEIERDVPESPYDFDQYDKSIVDFTIDNNGSMDDLLSKVTEFLDQ